jgi:hypothetical protein
VVSDLVDDAQTPIDALAAIIQQFVAPESWQGRQGQGTIEPDDGALTVVQPNAVQQQVLAFCERLRLARKKPLQSREDAARFSLTTRAAQGKEFLARPVTANFHEPTPLRQVLTYLVATNPSDATPCDILIDHIALAAAETSDRVDASVVAQATPLGDTLNELLRPLGLAYRIVDAHTLQVTTKDALDDRLELEFYPVGRLLTADWGSRVLTDEIKREVSPGSWSDTGGLGEIYFDAPSGCLLVLQSQPTQAAVAHFLAAKP